MMATTQIQANDPRQLGAYRLITQLGAGGMGVVYLAQTAAGQPVAIKMIRREFVDDVGDHLKATSAITEN